MIQLITNENLQKMRRCSIIELSPPTPPRIGFCPLLPAGIFLPKFLQSWRRGGTFWADVADVADSWKFVLRWPAWQSSDYLLYTIEEIAVATGSADVRVALDVAMQGLVNYPE